MLVDSEVTYERLGLVSVHLLRLSGSREDALARDEPQGVDDQRLLARAGLRQLVAAVTHDRGALGDHLARGKAGLARSAHHVAVGGHQRRRAADGHTLAAWVDTRNGHGGDDGGRPMRSPCPSLLCVVHMGLALKLQVQALQGPHAVLLDGQVPWQHHLLRVQLWQVVVWQRLLYHLHRLQLRLGHALNGLLGDDSAR